MKEDSDYERNNASFGDGFSRDFSVDDNFSLDSGANHSADERVKQLSEQETRNIKGCRFVILLLILAACVIMSTASYLYLRGEDNDDYIASYERFVETIAEITEFEMKNLVGVSKGLAETFTSAGQAQSSTSFPYVSPPMFEIAARNARQQSGVEIFVYTPLVTNTSEWVEYANQHQGWVQESRSILVDDGLLDPSALDVVDDPIYEQIWVPVGDDDSKLSPGDGPFAPIWHSSPPPFRPQGFLNMDIFARPVLAQIFHALAIVGAGLMTEVSVLTDLSYTAISDEEHTKFHQQFVEELHGETYYHHPHSVYAQPVFREIGSTDIVACLFGVVAWDRFLAGLLPREVKGIYAVLKNSCGQDFTYVINGGMTKFLGEGDLHESGFKDTERVIPLSQYYLDPSVSHHAAGHCVYNLHVYSSSQFKEASLTRLAITFAIAISLIFAVMTIAFLFYDRFVRKRNDKVINAAAKSDAILSSLYPSTIRDRLFAEKAKEDKAKESHRRKHNSNNKAVPKARLKSYLHSGEFSEKGEEEDNNNHGGSLVFKSKPIADLFPETTIMFGDIAGFTAWSSVREPSQVFTLLETLYHAFDELARKRRVFKVETVGDCYVAVAGLPDPQEDHAIIMCRFARACMFKVQYLTKKLEVVLGPDTGDLAMRIGLHSGPVTAGVLRGERSRFQLFGDTMNTASRMESTGTRDKIQISQETADLLTGAGKSNWFERREEKIVAKGKGELQTYWLKLGGDRSDTTSNTPSSLYGDAAANGMDAGTLETAAEIFDGRTTRLIDWNVDVLIRLLKQIVAHRKAAGVESKTRPDERVYQQKGRPLMDEVKEVITLPEFDGQAFFTEEDTDDVKLNEEVIEQLHDYVCNIAAIYRDNPFHSFEHASHVTMSVTKLLSRIVAPSELDFDENAVSMSGKKKIAYTLHDHTYGITSDPLTQFSCVFSALIHDADHTGVPNAQLVKEDTSIAKYYQNQSVAEQNSIDLSWDLLMDSNYDQLRATIYTTDAEMTRFRQLVVNSVMATDIVDKELKVLRNLRWDRAFNDSIMPADLMEDRNRKATIVIEHLIQASDVAHTMQHWHIYRKWNERFFMECYEAFLNGRAEKDPAEGWYEGELGFYDYYIIPLAKKLKNCGVFGVSSDEYLNYAIKNREEWEIRGREIVDEMLEKVHKLGHDRSEKMQAEPVVISSPQLKTNMAPLA